jgi:phytoene dehydrogenase-like protein
MGKSVIVIDAGFGGFFRSQNRHPRYHNLFFVGASTHPGTGLPTGLVSSRLTAERNSQDTPLGKKIIPTSKRTSSQ